MVRSNSIEVILLEDEEYKKQNMYPIGEDDRNPTAAYGML